MRRTLAATLVALFAVFAIGLPSAQSDPSGGVQVTPLADFNAAEQRITDLEQRVTDLEATPTPTPEPSPTPTPTPTVSPTPTPTPSPTPTATPVGEFPNAANTGVPDGTVLAAYTGPMTISSPTVIDSKTVTGTLTVTGGSLTVRNSVINGRIFSQRDNGATMLIEDTTINVPNANVAGLERHHYVARRIEVKGGIRSLECTSNCEVYDSWLHGQWMPTSGDPHGDGFLSNGGSNMVIQHNTLACDSEPNGSGGACSAAVALYGDNEAIRNVVVKDNLFKAAPSSYCMYAGAVPGKPYGGFNVDITGNVFERFAESDKTPKQCAYFGSVSATPWDADSSWSGNRYTDGTTLNR